MSPLTKEELKESSNINAVIRAILNVLFFCLRKDFARTKSIKKTKKKNTTQKNANKRIKIKNVYKKHLRGKKSLIRLFAFLCLRRKK